MRQCTNELQLSPDTSISKALQLLLLSLSTPKVSIQQPLVMASDIEAFMGVAANALGTLLPAFKVVQLMMDSYSRIKFARRRCKVLIQRAALMIKEVHHMNLQKSETLTSNIIKLEVYVHTEY